LDIVPCFQSELLAAKSGFVCHPVRLSTAPENADFNLCHVALTPMLGDVMDNRLIDKKARIRI